MEIQVRKPCDCKVGCVVCDYKGYFFKWLTLEQLHEALLVAAYPKDYEGEKP